MWWGIETFFELAMPIGETLTLSKMEFAPSQGNGVTSTVSIVSGIHGDELDGLYITYLLKQFLHSNRSKLRGKVKLIPVMNPSGIDVSHRFWPFTKIDINRQFPGDPSGESTQRIAHAIFNELKESRLVIDIHSSNLFVFELPQVRILEKFSEQSLPLTAFLGVPLVWMHAAPTVIETTLSYNLNQQGIPTLVIECGISHRLTLSYCQQIFEGILNLFHHLKILETPARTVLKGQPKIATDSNVTYLNAEHAGLFLSQLEVGTQVRKNDLVGEIFDPVRGEKAEEVLSPADGLLFTIRSHPVCYPGSLLGRIVSDKS